MRGMFCLFSENNTFFSTSFQTNTHFMLSLHKLKSSLYAAKRVNKHKTWLCCRETHGACMIYKSNGPDDALMVAHMEVLAMLLTWLMKAGWRKQWREETTMGGAGQSKRDCQWACSSPELVLQAWSVFCICLFLLLSHPFLKSTT